MVVGEIHWLAAADETRRPAVTGGLYQWDDRVKVAVLLLAIVLNSWVAVTWLSLLVLTIGLLVIIISRVPWRQLLPYLLIPVWPNLLVIAGFGFAFGAVPYMHLAGYTIYSDGLLRGCQVALRAYCDVIWFIACILTTPFPRLLAALRWYRVPAIITETLAMMYRYVFLLCAEFRRMQLAAHARGGTANFKMQMQTLGRITAQIFMRAFDRSERIYWAMVARGGEQLD